MSSSPNQETLYRYMINIQFIDLVWISHYGPRRVLACNFFLLVWDPIQNHMLHFVFISLWFSLSWISFSSFFCLPWVIFLKGTAWLFVEYFSVGVYPWFSHDRIQVIFFARSPTWDQVQPTSGIVLGETFCGLLLLLKKLITGDINFIY